MFLIPGNHDINVVNRANPAQFDLPTSPNKKLRKLRVLSALNAIQGSRVRVLDRRSKRLDETLEHALNPYVAGMVTFAETGQAAGLSLRSTTFGRMHSRWRCHRSTTTGLGSSC